MEYLDKYYTHQEIVDLLEKAERLGFDLEAGSWLEQLTIAELDRLVNVVHG